MIITQVICEILRIDGVEAKTASSQDAIVVRVITDTGLEGIGEADSAPEVVQAIIDAPFSHNTRWGHHFQITNPLPADFHNNFIFLGYVDEIGYLKNKHIINLVDIKTVPFNKKPIKIYEVIF